MLQLHFFPHNFRSVGPFTGNSPGAYMLSYVTKEFTCENHHDSSADIYVLVFPNGI